MTEENRWSREFFIRCTWATAAVAILFCFIWRGWYVPALPDLNTERQITASLTAGFYVLVTYTLARCADAYLRVKPD